MKIKEVLKTIAWLSAVPCFILAVIYFKTIVYPILSCFGAVTSYHKIGETEVSEAEITQKCNIYIANCKYPCLAIGSYRFHDSQGNEYYPDYPDFLFVNRGSVNARIRNDKEDKPVVIPWRMYLAFDPYCEVSATVCVWYNKVCVVHDPEKGMYHYTILPDEYTGPTHEIKFSISEKEWNLLPADDDCAD